MTAEQTNSTNGHYMVISHGNNGLGARSASGALIGACTTAGAPREQENCDADAVFFEVTDDNGRSLANGPFYFDDITLYSTAVPSRIWVEGPAGQDIISNNLLIGVGVELPEATLHVAGNVLADGGELRTPTVCDSTPPAGPVPVPPPAPDCFSPDLIGGSGMDCEEEGGLNGVRNGAEVCSLSVNAAVNADTCPTGRFVVGIDASGDIQCSSP